MPRAAWMLLLGGVVLLLGGCLSARPPGVEVVGAEVVERSGEGVSLAVTLRLTNPNAVALPLPEASYSVQVEGVEDRYSYVELPARVIPPKGEQTVTLPAAVALPGALPGAGAGDAAPVAGRRWRVNGTVTYEPENGMRTFLTESGVPLPLVFFSGEGRLR